MVCLTPAGTTVDEVSIPTCMEEDNTDASRSSTEMLLARLKQTEEKLRNQDDK
jgi:hypothetical protein